MTRNTLLEETNKNETWLVEWGQLEDGSYQYQSREVLQKTICIGGPFATQLVSSRKAGPEYEQFNAGSAYIGKKYGLRTVLVHNSILQQAAEEFVQAKAKRKPA